MSWYRIYRPKKVAQLHLTTVREQLLQLLKSGRLPQVLLLAGPKGSGKTSTARILASIVNNPDNEAVVSSLFTAHHQPAPLKEPDLSNDLVQRIQSGQSYVVQELDAASNRGIDEVRRLKEEVALPPQEGKIKVYILDEVHMFTTEAFNALLKLLEEPPSHVMFILATTELHKIPETIGSRSTLIPFHKATTAELVAALQAIVDSEKITAEPEALEIIARRADGSFRDAVKTAELLFNQFSALTLETVGSLEAGYDQSSLQQLLDLVLAKDEVGVMQFFSKMREQNLQPTEFFKRWLMFLHDQLVAALENPAGKASVAALTYILKTLMLLPAREVSPLPFLTLEITLLDMVLRSKQQAGGGQQTKTVKSAPEPKQTTKSDTPKKSSPILNSNPQPILYSDNLKPVQTVPDVIAMTPMQPGDSDKLFEEWKTFVTMVEKEHTGVAIILRSAKPLHTQERHATVAVFYPFHKQCLEEPKTRQILDSCVRHIAGGPVEIEFVVEQEKTARTEEISNDAGLVELAQDLLV